MKKLLTVILIFSSINVAAGQVWAQYDFQVESAEAQAKIIAASNELMSSDFAKENLKGSVLNFPKELKKLLDQKSTIE